MLLFERSLTIVERALGPEHPYVGRELGNLAGLYQELGNFGKASILLGQSQRIYENALDPDHPWVATNLSALASLHSAMGEYSKALPLYRQVLQIGNQSKNPELLWRAQDGLRNVLVNSNQPDVAIVFGKQAVNTIQELRTRLINIDRGLQQSFLKDKVGAYRNLADVLIDRGRLAEAQQVLAMLKEEEYFDFVRRDTNFDVRNTTASLTGPEQRWGDRFSEIGKRVAEQAVERDDLRRRARLGLTDTDRERLTLLESNLKVARQLFDETLNQLLIEFGNASGERRVEIGMMNLPSLRAMQGTLQELGHGAVILNYLITDRKLRILLTTPQIQIARESTVTGKELNRKIEAYREVLRNPTRDPIPHAQELYRLLIAPISDDLVQSRAETLMVSLDGTLRYVPFAALYNGKEYLIERYSIAMFTEAAKDKIKDRSTMPWRLAGLGLTREIEGFSPLPAVREELNGIVRTSKSPMGVLPGTIQLDADFSSETMQRVLDDAYPVLHVASHFVFKPGTDSDSFLLLGDGRKLSLREIKDENFDFRHVELLTLSGCDTAVGGGADANGREVEGLGALAQKQGAKGILATLWSVADQSTGQLMQNFYRLRNHGKITKSEALRRAQLQFLRGVKPGSVIDGTPDQVTTSRLEHPAQSRGAVTRYPVDPQKPYAHPFYWAPFVLIGNWL